MKKQSPTPQARHGAAASASSRESTAPGKRTRSGALPERPSAGQGPVQRKAGAEAPPSRSWLFDAGILAAHGFASDPAPVQARGNLDPAADVHRAASHGIGDSASSLPHLDSIQRSFGAHDVGGIKSHVGGAASAACDGMGAEAYATGDHVAFRGTPDLHTAAHEAAHVVQQRGGVQLAGGVGQAGDAYERHADAVADAVVAGASAEPLLGQMAPAAAGSQGSAAAGTQMVQRLQVAQLGPDQVCWDDGVQVRITASRLNVRTTPSSASRASIVGQLACGQSTEAFGREGDWLMIQFGGQHAYIHGGYVEPMETAPAPDTAAGGTASTEGGTAPAESSAAGPSPAPSPAPASTTATGGGEPGLAGLWPFSLVWPVSDQPPAETEPPPEAATPQGSQQPQQGEAQAPDTSVETNAVLRLVNDFNNVPVWARGEAAPDHEPSHYQTPYFLNSSTSDVKWSGRSAVGNLTIAQGRAHAGEKVEDAIDGSRAWVGKGTPEEMHIIGQAIIDNQHDGQTPSSIQAYVNDGVERKPGRRNGKWGVDCSGFTSQMMQELEGDGRSGFTSTNAASFRHDGSRGFTPTNPQDARMGDVISFQSTNHVVVVFAKWDVRLPLAGGDTAQTRPAVMMGVGESGASQDADSGQFVRSDRRFFYFPDATSVMGQTNPDGPAYRLANSRNEDLPHWQPALTQASYAGSDQWTGGFTLNCASDSSGTNIRVRNDDGSFTSTSALVPNGAGGVELKEVADGMVRIRIDGVDTRNGKTTWAPVGYVASMGAGYSIPSSGQPVDRSPKLYSVVRNPDLDDPAPAQEAQPQE